MKSRKFLISSLAMAGLVKPGVAGAALPAADDFGATNGTLDSVAVDRFRQDHLFHLTGHSSHSSHASHASHSSGASGRVYIPTYSPPSPPAPVYTEPLRAIPAPRVAPLLVVPTTPIAPATKPLRGGTEQFTEIVRRVQLGLHAYGYYDGATDGVVGATMKDALRRFQGDYKLKVTGTITPEVLDALQIAAR